MSTPYATQALAYLEGGLGSPIPSMYPYEKHPPLVGYTGRSGLIPSQRDVERWCEHYPDSNVLVRMAPNVIGIDVDDYDDKSGGATMSAIIEQHGPLPWTHVSTARELPSGIYWYRLHSNMQSDRMRDPGDHVEVIRHEHRYAVAPPSWHPSARTRYRWVDGAQPQLGDLGLLPVEWYSHLTQSCDCFRALRRERAMQAKRFQRRPSGEAGRELALLDLRLKLEKLEDGQVGSRNTTLSWIAGRTLLHDVMANGVLGYDEVVDQLTASAQRAGLEDREIERTIESAARWVQEVKDNG